MYKLPETLGDDITRLAVTASEYQAKKIPAVQFKAFRVPMGIYEQRKDEVYMARIRATGGVISPEQLRAVVDIARRHGSDLLHLTTRQEIQIQNLSLDRVEPVLRELQQIGLATKGGGGNTVRNIMVSEGSGISADEVFDPTPFADALTTRLIAEPDSYLLPRKLKIAFSAGDEDPGYAAVNDIGFVATVKDGLQGFRVYVGGGGGSKPTVGWLLFDFIPLDKIYAVAEAVKKFFSGHGNRKNKHKARLRYIFYRLGEAETLRLIREYCEDALQATPTQALPDAEPQRPPFDYAPPDAAPSGDAFDLWKKRYAAPQKQDGYYSILVPIPAGDIHIRDEQTVSGIRALTAFIARFGRHTIRFTNSQNLRLRNIPEAALPEIYGITAQFVPEIHSPVLAGTIVSCTGADTCRLGIGLAKGLARAVRNELLRGGIDVDRLADVKIRVSGCPNSCGQQFWADIGFSGKILRNDRIYPGYQVYLAARRHGEPRLAEAVGHISARDVPAFVRRLLQAYLDAGAGSITDYLEAEGRETALRLIDEYRVIPAFDDDKNYYYDWGADTPFSIVDRGTAECSAGLFDMIDVDADSIRANRAALETETDAQEVNRLLYEIVFAASRMLLVTRGAEPRSGDDVFNLFIKKFIDFGFVDEAFRDLVVAARDDRGFDFAPRRAEIFALADAVDELYRNMDDSLQFKQVKEPPAQPVEPAPQPVEPPAPPAPSAPAHRYKDLRGVACPMNFVQTKIVLAQMQPGEALDILLDDGPPIENVPGSVRGEGHEIPVQERIGDYWKLTIIKK
ncbi:MAG: sulfurtransferase TusA family protein [Tannerella sp.]|jgi:sulfite reductase (ferredoxin)|nr:sulfurtransferase TusA family protein [Tannerella sp.]